jgi:cytidine deaminase
MANQHPSGLTAAQIEDLRQRAAKAAEHSHSPYSHFRVGAALLIELPGVENDAQREPVIVTGCNVENASYRLTTCAEQAAIATAVGLYGPGIRLRAVAVANLNGVASMPCGACRQTILEFSRQDIDMPNTWIFYPAEQGAAAEATLTDLLPAAFRLT